MIQIDILLPAFTRGFHIITNEILTNLPELPETGLLHLFILHTSAGICINLSSILPNFHRSIENGKILTKKMQYEQVNSRLFKVNTTSNPCLA